MKQTKELILEKHELERINHLLHTEPKSSEECFGEDEKISNTVRFENGYEMDIELCGVQYGENESSNLPWTQAVLFKNGIEVAFTEVSDEYDGEWILENDGNQFVVIIKEEE